MRFAPVGLVVLLLCACGREPADPAPESPRLEPPISTASAEDVGRADSSRPRAGARATEESPDLPTTEADLPSTPSALADLLLGGTLPADAVPEVLEALASHGPAALPELIRLLASERHATWACVRLQEFGRDAAPAASALARCIAEDRAPVEASHVLICIGAEGASAASPLVASEDPFIRALALRTLGSIGAVPPDGEAAIFRAVSDEDDEVRRGAAFALRAIQADPRRAVASLLGLLGDEDLDVRHAALRTLREQSDLLEAHVGTLVAHAERRSEDLLAAMHVLDAMGPSATLAALRSPVVEVRALAVQYADAADAAVRDRLITLLSDEAPNVAATAFMSLSQLDDPPPEAVRRAAALLADPVIQPAAGDWVASYVAAGSRKAAVRITETRIARGSAKVDALLPSLADPAAEVRGAAAVALLRSAPEADLARVLDAVRPQWQGDGLSLDLRLAVAAEAGARQGAGSDAVPWLARYAESGDVQRVEALTALGRISDPKAVTILLGQLDVVIWEVRVAVAALGGHLTTDERVVPALLGQLRNGPRAEVRSAAAAALASLRSRPEVRAALEAAKRDRDVGVRKAAEAALGE